MAYRPKVAVMAAMGRGQRLLKRGRVADAVRSFDRAVRLDPGAPQPYLYRAGIKLIAGDDPGALADFRAISNLDHAHLPAYRDLTTPSAEDFPGLIPASARVLRLDPFCAWAHVFHAFSKRSLMRYEEAVEDLRRAVACEPNSAALWAMQSRVKLTNRQDFYDGVRDMERAVALAPDWGWLHCWLGEALRHQGRHKRALACLDRGLALDPRYKRGYAWRGGVKVALGLYKSALADLERSLAFDPIYHYDFEYTADQKSWAYNQKMLARRGLGEAEAALAELREAHRYGPRYGWGYNPKGDPRRRAADLAELDRLLKKKPRLAWARAWRGWIQLQAGLTEPALADLQAALELSPRLAWPLAWKGKALFSVGRFEEARAALRSACRLDPAYAPAWGWLGEACRALGRLEEAEACFSRAVRLDHRCSWAFAGRGEARLRRGDLAGAERDLDRALFILPGYPEALSWRAQLKLRRRDFGGSLEDADAALGAKPSLALAYVTRSLAKQGLRDFRGQREDLQKALSLDPVLAEKARGLEPGAARR